MVTSATLSVTSRVARMAVEQHQQPGDPIARLQSGVFDQILDLAPSFVVAG
jgi:hypothetical protein